MSKKSLVALAHGLDVQENVTRVFDMMGGAAKMIEPNSTVVLKPNAGHAAPPEFAVCTHPETVRAVIREVKRPTPSALSSPRPPPWAATPTSAMRPAASPPSPGRRASTGGHQEGTRISSM